MSSARICCAHIKHSWEKPKPSPVGIPLSPFSGTPHSRYLVMVDVGPATRQFLTRADGFFGGPDHLTLCDKLVRGQVPERAVRAALIIVEPPRFDDGLCLGECGELVHVQTLIPHAAVKRFNEGIFYGFAWSNEVELDTPLIGPIFKRA